MEFYRETYIRSEENVGTFLDMQIELGWVKMKFINFIYYYKLIVEVFIEEISKNM